MINKKHINKIKNLLFFLAVIFAFFQFYKNFNYLLEQLSNKWFILFLLIPVHSLFHFFYSFRSFLVLKNSFSKLINFQIWNKNYFQSILIQESLISNTGFLYRSLYLNELGLKIIDLIIFFYYGISSYISFNLILIYFEVFFISDISLINSFYLFFINLFIIIFFIFSPILIFKIINKIRFTKNLFLNLIPIDQLNSKYLKILFNKNNILYLCLTGVSIHIFEVTILYFSITFFSIDILFFNLVLLFAFSIFSDRIPFISSIPFFNEIIFGLVSSFVGFTFYEGFMVKSLMRISSISSLAINLFINRYLKKF